MTNDPLFGARTIRPSSLTTWADCARRAAARQLSAEIQAAGYTLRQEARTHVGAAVGSGVHASAAYTLETKRQTGEIGAASEAEDRAIQEFDARAQFGLGWDAVTDNVSTAKKQVVRMSKAFRTHLAPVIEPILVETRLVADVGDGWSLSGQLDTLNGDPDSALRDLKTGARQRGNGVQYGAYTMLFRGHGYQVSRISEDFLPRVRLDKEQPAPIPTAIDLQAAIYDAWEIIDEIKRTTAVFQTRLADPNGRPPHAAFKANPASQMCGEKWCSAWGTKFCTAHRR